MHSLMGFSAGYRPTGQNSKMGVMSGLATIRPEPAICPSTRLDECVDLLATVDIAGRRVAGPQSDI